MKGTIKELIPKMLNLEQEKIYILEEYKEKRSLDSNAYCWHLIGKIADLVRVSKEQVYLKYLKEYGQSIIIKVDSNIAVESFFKYFDLVNIKEKYSYYKVYKGSSEFNTKEMSIFIDGIVQEAQDLGIETMTPNEIANLKSLWSSNEK